MAIQYPINPETDRFTVYDTDTGSPLLDGRGRPMTSKKWGSRDTSQMIPNLAPNIKWLINVKEDAPAYDSSTQKLVRSTTYDVDAETATDGYEVVALTQEEIDARTPASFTTSGGIKLAVEEQDQNAFARMKTLLDLQGAGDADPITIKDVDGATHTITVADFNAAMLEYGVHCYTAFLSE